jgi:sulfate/thiosulfate transport system permease protein
VSGIASALPRSAARSLSPALSEPRVVRWLLVGLALFGLVLLIVLPLALVFVAAFADGIGVFVEAIADPDTRSALWLSLLTAAIVLPLHLFFGTALAWLLAKYDFRGKTLLITLIDLPFSVSPLVAGLLFVLLFGAHGWLDPLLSAADLKVIFAPPGIVLATAFITFPIVAREVHGALEAQGSDQEEAALTLGASGWQILWRITLPNVRWGMMYGAVLCTARALGEFGAVSVVSGHIRGETNTLPLHVEILYNEYRFAAAFAVASLLAGLALVTLVLKRWIERKSAALEVGS